MIRRLTTWLTERTLRTAQPRNQKLNRLHTIPCVFGQGELRFHFETVERLESLRMLGHYHREQLEAIGDECCALMGFDPERESVEADICREIADSGLSVSDCFEKLCEIHRNKEEADADY